MCLLPMITNSWFLVKLISENLILPLWAWQHSKLKLPPVNSGMISFFMLHKIWEHFECFYNSVNWYFPNTVHKRGQISIQSTDLTKQYVKSHWDAFRFHTALTLKKLPSVELWCIQGIHIIIRKDYYNIPSFSS